MTTTVDVITFALEYFLPPPSGDESPKHLIEIFIQDFISFKKGTSEKPSSNTQLRLEYVYMC